MTATGEGRAAGGRLVRMKDVVHLTGLSQATINRLHRRGDFPPKRRLTAGCVGWWQRDIEDWAASRDEVPRRPGDFQVGVSAGASAIGDRAQRRRKAGKTT